MKRIYVNCFLIMDQRHQSNNRRFRPTYVKILNTIQVRHVRFTYAIISIFNHIVSDRIIYGFINTWQLHQFDECLYAKHKRNRGKVILSLFIISTTVVEAMMSHVKYIWDNSQQVSNSMSELLIFSRQKDEDAIASLKKHSTSKSQNICDQ